MTPGFVFKLRPTGPWRIGPDDGDRRKADLVYHSDALYSAVTGAMLEFGLLDAWLDATARASDGSAVRFSSCFPWIGRTKLVSPPKHIWPAVPSPKMRWKGARYIPLALVADLLAGKTPDDNRWAVDGPGGCLLPAGSPSNPFRLDVRSSAAVDRLGAGVAGHSAACVEFSANAGLWGAVAFAGPDAADAWSGPVKGAIRLWADSGFGGGRSRGWGRSESPEFRDGFLPGLILRSSEASPAPPEDAMVEPQPGSASEENLPQESEQDFPTQGDVSRAETVHWLLSLFTPGAADEVDWGRGSYTVVTRAGRVESRVRSGDEKRLLNMVEEGSVLVARERLQGAAVDVAPGGFPHPVYRFGCALSIRVPGQVRS